MADKLVVVSKVKDAVKLRVSGEAIDALSAYVKDVLKRAETAAKEAGMETIKARHIDEAVEPQEEKEE